MTHNRNIRPNRWTQVLSLKKMWCAYEKGCGE